MCCYSQNVNLLYSQAFDYENGCRSYDLIVEAQDQATPIMLDTANITITIVDVNDNSPLFSSPSYILSVRNEYYIIILYNNII